MSDRFGASVCHLEGLSDWFSVSFLRNSLGLKNTECTKARLSLLWQRCASDNRACFDKMRIFLSDSFKLLWCSKPKRNVRQCPGEQHYWFLEGNSSVSTDLILLPWFFTYPICLILYQIWLTHMYHVTKRTLVLWSRCLDHLINSSWLWTPPW